MDNIGGVAFDILLGKNDLSTQIADATKTATKVGVAALAAGFVSIATTSIKTADEVTGAINDIEAATGKADNATTGFKDTLLDIYKNNFGDSFEDIASAMTTVEQQTGQVGEALKDTTTNALTLRDAFDMDVTESVRAANMMMDQFGLTSEESFNLIAQGAQNGLDKNGDLLDSINEYSNYFNMMGLSADDMFNMLENGAESGAFSVDKLGDTMKEFSIRAIDGSNTTSDAFKSLGLDATAMGSTFASGGDNAKQALFQVADALNGISDPVEQNRIGVELFGTQWEDLGVAGVNALLNINGEIDSTKSTLDDINAVKYDTLGEAISGIGRTIQTDLMVPLGDELLPKFNELAQWVVDNMPQIEETVSGVFNGIADAISWVIDNADWLIPVLAGVLAGFVAFSIVTTISTMMAGLSVIIEGTTGVMGALNAIMMANPMVFVAIVIGILIAAIVLLVTHFDQVKEVATKIWNKVKEVFMSAFNAIVNFVTKTIPEKFGQFISFLGSLPGKAWNKLTEVVSKVIAWGGELVSKAKTAGTNMVNGVVDTIKSLPGKMLDIGGDLVEGLWNGISNMKNWIVNKVKNFGGNVLDGIKGFFGIHSPSRVFRDEVGQMLMLGLGNGIDENADVPLDAINANGKEMLKAAIANNEALDLVQSPQTLGTSDSTIQSAVTTKLQDSTLSINQGIIDKLNAMLDVLTAIMNNPDNHDIYLDGKTLVGKLTNEINKNLGKLQALEAR